MSTILAILIAVAIVWYIAYRMQKWASSQPFGIQPYTPVDKVKPRTIPAPPIKTLPITIIREYKSIRAYQKGAEKLSRDGYRVVSTVAPQLKKGCFRIFWFGGFRERAGHVVATFERRGEFEGS